MLVNRAERWALCRKVFKSPLWCRSDDQRSCHAAKCQLDQVNAERLFGNVTSRRRAAFVLGGHMTAASQTAAALWSGCDCLMAVVPRRTHQVLRVWVCVDLDSQLWRICATQLVSFFRLMTSAESCVCVFCFHLTHRLPPLGLRRRPRSPSPPLQFYSRCVRSCPSD